MILALLADALVVLALVVMTVGVLGMFRMSDLLLQLHAASKAVVLGVASLCLASVVTGDGAIIARVALVAAFLLLTTPVSAHAIARAEHLAGDEDSAHDEAAQASSS